MITITFQDKTGTTVASMEIDDFGPTVVVVSRGSNSELVINSFEPLEINDHPDTLKEIGSRIVSCAKQSLPGQ